MVFDRDRFKGMLSQRIEGLVEISQARFSSRGERELNGASILDASHFLNQPFLHQMLHPRLVQLLSKPMRRLSAASVSGSLRPSSVRTVHCVTVVPAQSVTHLRCSCTCRRATSRSNAPVERVPCMFRSFALLYSLRAATF